jgi:Fe-S cluster assembly protein SufD
VPKWLEDARRAAIVAFDKVGFPGPKNEDWKYTGVTPIVSEPFYATLGEEPAAYDSSRVAALVRSLAIPAGEPALVFVNGEYAANFSSVDATGVACGFTVRSLAVDLGATDSIAAYWLERKLDASAHGFAALNTAFADDGAAVRIGEGRVADKPLHLAYVGVATGKPALAHLRNVIVAESGSAATIVEHYVGEEGVYLTNTATEIALARNATLRHVKIQDEAETAYHVARVEAEVAEHASLASHVVTIGGALSRSEIYVRLVGRNAECRLDGLYALSGERHADHHTVVDHVVAETKSFENYKGVIDGSSRGVFTGRVMVRRDSQKVEARQQNKNLLLSEGAVVETRPQLEIYADDVQCSHGAAIGRLDESALFYLRQRGLDIDAARGLLTWAFASEILDRLPGEALRQTVTERVRLVALERAGERIRR